MRTSKLAVYLELAVAATLAGSVSSAKAAVEAWNLVPTLDPNNGTALTVADAATNTTTARGVSLATFTTQVAAAYAANLGGIINWDGAGANSTQLTTVAANATTGFSGAPAEGFLGANPVGGGVPSSTPLISLIRTDANASATVALDWNTQGAILASGNASSGGYLGIQGTASYTLTFQPAAGLGVTEFGITSIARNATGNTSGGNFMATFSDNSTYTTSTEVVTSTTTTPAPATFFGMQAPAGLTITSVTFNSTGANSARFDDTAFVLAPVPEPTSISLVGVGSLALLRRNRRVVARV